MKKIKLMYFLALFVFLSTSVIGRSFAVEPEASEKMGREILDNLKDAQSFNKDVQSVGNPRYNVSFEDNSR